jgi:hypothetical protein
VRDWEDINDITTGVIVVGDCQVLSVRGRTLYVRITRTIDLHLSTVY